MKKVDNTILRCPCPQRVVLTDSGGSYTCSDLKCQHAISNCGFQKISDVPILICDVKCDTVCDPARIASYMRRSANWFHYLKERFLGQKKITERNCTRFVELVKLLSNKPRVLVVGSGTKGQGAGSLWNDEGIEVCGVDVYVSSSVSIVCDAHYLPFADASFDGIWIQAVLEHVVEPNKVVEELFRVVKESGFVYAETPFMQHVHEGAYDFTRFSVVGHRFLFKRFKSIDFGPLNGADVSLGWSVKYFLIALIRNVKISKLISIFFETALIPFRFLISDRSRFDSCSGSYFLGVKDGIYQVSHKEVVRLYNGQIK